ncbi:MAG: pectin acetylesterase-family hydrolase [Anaeromyxobacteraceae bacterium]
MHSCHLAAIVSLALASACAPNTTPITKKGYQGKPPIGTAMTFAPADELLDGTGARLGWWWIPFDGTSASDEVAYCGDGSATGLAISPGTGKDLLVFFDGGGACWSYETCALGTAVDKSFDKAKFITEATNFIPSSITSRANLPAALAGATIVFVPYCTGDVHGGDNVADYGNMLVSEIWHHVGHANVMAYLKRLSATFPNPGKLVVAGSSAGGFGALVNYEAFRWYWPRALGYLIDDSGPALVNNDVPANLRDAWYNAWHLGVATDPFCVGCRSNLASAFTELSDMHPSDRIAFVSHTQDHVMAPFTLSTGAEFEAAIRRLEWDFLRPTVNVRVFYETGTDHMMLTPLVQENPVTVDYMGTHFVGTTSLADWVQQMVSGGAWDTLMSP